MRNFPTAQYSQKFCTVVKNYTRLYNVLIRRIMPHHCIWVSNRVSLRVWTSFSSGEGIRRSQNRHVAEDHSVYNQRKSASERCVSTCEEFNFNSTLQSALIMPIIQFVMPSRNKHLKKLLHFYWEVCPKYDENGKLKQEMILVVYVQTILMSYTVLTGTQ